MPTFFRKSSSKKRSLRPRKFVAAGKPKKVSKPSIKKVIESKQKPLLPDINKINEREDVTLGALDTLLKSHQAERHEESKPVNSDNFNAIYRDEAETNEFNGVSDSGEQKEYFGSVIDYERKKKVAVEEQIKLLEREKAEERKALEREIRSLKEELHRTNPIQNNKFFSLSKELRSAVEDIERLAAENGVDTETKIDTEEVKKPIMIQREPTLNAEITPKIVQIPQQSPDNTLPTDEVKKRNLPKKKLLITGASAVVLVMVASGLMSGTLTGKAKVDQKIVSSYLESQSGQIQGVETSVNGKVEIDPSQAVVSFEQSDWKEYKDGNFGILLQYPKNAVKPIKTDSNVTFIRKTGYLFKVQRVETALTVEEYWKQIKATSLNFEVSEEKFKGKSALKLALIEVTDYPGDRYLVKEGDYIYDVWYATPSNNFLKDDILMAEKMLASLSIIGVQ